MPDYPAGMGKPVFLTYVPQYLVTQLGFDLKSAGLVSSLPFLANSGGSLFAGELFSTNLDIAAGDVATLRLSVLCRHSGRLPSSEGGFVRSKLSADAL